MRKVLLLFVCLSFVTDLYSQEPKFYLSQTRAELGDPVFVIVETEGVSEVRILEKEFHGPGLKAVYWGMEDSTTIVNFKTFRKKLLKYRLVASAPGKYSVPEIAVEIEGKRYGAAGLVVEFGARRSASKNPGSLWNRFFSTEDNQGPADGDLKVVFQLDKKEVWVGQPVLGFFTLYYRNAIRPYFDRDPSSSIEFPYFRSEILSGIGLTIPETVLYEGLEYETSPYNKEFFVLTPLKKGEYSLGSTTFHLEGQLQSYFHMRTIKTIPSRITVRDLPVGAPSSFGGAVGKFTIVLEEFPKEAHLGDPFQFKLTVRGQGNLSSIKDPLRIHCGENDCYPEITFLQVRPHREFKELDRGEYGFYLTNSYTYSVLPKTEGIWKREDFKFAYFDPGVGRYIETSVRFPTIRVGSPLPKSETTESKQKEYSLGPYFGFALLGIFLGGIGFYALGHLRKRSASARLLKQLDLWIGSKRGFVLKHSAISKGLTEEEATQLAGWKTEDIPLIDTFRTLGTSSRESLIRIAKRLSENEQEDEFV